MKRLRILFFGTPQLSADILRYLSEQTEIEIIGAVTNPDKIGGRGHELIASPVAQFAREKNMPLYQPEKIRNNSEFFQTVRDLQVDICLVVAYGKILPQELLDISPMGFLNVHTSLLPKYRGAAPIQHALLNGEKTTGLTVQQMALAMDEGDILLQEFWDISPSDTTGGLFAKTGERGGPLLMKAIIGLRDKTITPIPQDHAQATYTKMIEKTDGQIQTDWTVDQAYHAWQAYTPWPSLFTFFGETKMTLLEVKPLLHTPVPSPSPIGEGLGERLQVGKENIFVYNGLPAIQLADGLLIIKKIHPAGKKPMSGEDFVRGFLQKK